MSSEFFVEAVCGARATYHQLPNPYSLPEYTV
jgi:hypothetical protein